MVHYEGQVIDYETADMYTRNATSAMYSVSQTYAPPTYQTAAQVDTNSTGYYEQHYNRAYWQHTSGKDDSVTPHYPHSGWSNALPYQTNIESADIVYKHPGYFPTHPQNDLISQGNPETHYSPCAIMATGSQGVVTHQQSMNDGMLKERQQGQNYSGWINSSLNNNCKTRTKDKYRVVYSDHQRLELEKEFHYSRYITIRRKAELAITLNLSERQVKIWFQNRRAKERKLIKKKGGSEKFVADAESKGSPSSSECAESTTQEMISHPDISASSNTLVSL